MKIFLTITALIAIVLLCDRYEERLPQPIAFLYGLWKKCSHVLGIVMSFVILTILWIVGFGVYGIIMKIITFPKRFAQPPQSYWIDVEPTSAESMRHQF